MVNLDERELATMLAALPGWQVTLGSGCPDAAALHAIAADDGTLDR